MRGHAALCIKGLAEVKDAVTCAGSRAGDSREQAAHAAQCHAELLLMQIKYCQKVGVRDRLGIQGETTLLPLHPCYLALQPRQLYRQLC